MRLWAFLVLLGVSQSLARSNRTKRQFEADHCDPAYCQIPVSILVDISHILNIISLLIHNTCHS